MAEVLHWQGAVDRRAVIHRAAAALLRGQLVAFPMEASYAVAAHALLPEAVEKLNHVANGSGEQPLTLALASAAHALDWAPGMGLMGRRLARRCWPGPVVLVFDDSPAGLARRLPESVRQRVCTEGKLRLHVPDHEAIWHALRLLPAPLVMRALPASEGNEAMHGLDVFVDDGPCRSPQPSTIVEVSASGWNMVREGVFSAAMLQEQTACLIVFVCTGNTCRSPMASALCSKLLADRLGCSVADLPARGYLIHSAGLSACRGERAAAEAMETVREFGADLSQHTSRPLTPELVAQADFLVTMTQGHLAALAARFPQGGARPRLLCPDADIADPIGGAGEVYRQCAQQILRPLEQLVLEVAPDSGLSTTGKQP